MVVISIIGVRTTMPKSIADLGCQRAFAIGDQRDIERLVPPISQVMMFSKPCRPDTDMRPRRDDPGRRDRTARCAPERRFAVSTDITPPLDCTIKASPSDPQRRRPPSRPVPAGRDSWRQPVADRRSALPSRRVRTRGFRAGFPTTLRHVVVRPHAAHGLDGSFSLAALA